MQVELEPVVSDDVEEVAAHVSLGEGLVVEGDRVQGLVDVPDQVEQVPDHEAALERGRVAVSQDVLGVVDQVDRAYVLVVLRHYRLHPRRIEYSVAEVKVVQRSEHLLLQIVGPHRTLRESVRAPIGEVGQGGDQEVGLVVDCGVRGLQFDLCDFGGEHVSHLPPAAGNRGHKQNYHRLLNLSTRPIRINEKKCSLLLIQYQMQGGQFYFAPGFYWAEGPGQLLQLFPHSLNYPFFHALPQIRQPVGPARQGSLLFLQQTYPKPQQLVPQPHEQTRKITEVVIISDDQYQQPSAAKTNRSKAAQATEKTMTRKKKAVRYNEIKQKLQQQGSRSRAFSQQVQLELKIGKQHQAVLPRVAWLSQPDFNLSAKKQRLKLSKCYSAEFGGVDDPDVDDLIMRGSWTLAQVHTCLAKREKGETETEESGGRAQQ